MQVVKPRVLHPLEPTSGGKGRGLLRLAAAGLPIPSTRVFPAHAFHAHLARHGIDPSDPEAGSKIGASTFEAPLHRSLVEEARRLGPRLAVRSSSSTEDGCDHSHAGVFRSMLNVAPEHVPAAILAVWASAFGPAARSYLVGPVQMSVLLQPQLDPVCAGVVFTVDPTTGSWRQMIVEAVDGQGEALVSGRQAPQWALLRRPRQLPAMRLWGRLGLRIVQRENTPQRVRWELSGDGSLVERPPSGSGPLLPDRALLALGRLALRAEAALDGPADVEWCWDGRAFTLLQARPITTTHLEPPRDVIWTRRFLGERFARPPTPLTWSILQPAMEHFVAYPDVGRNYLGSPSAFRLHEGHAYVNVTLFRHLLFKGPGMPAPGFMLELLPPEEADAFRRRFRVRADGAVYRAIFATTLRERRWRRFAFNPFTNHAIWDEVVEELRTSLAELSGPSLGPLDALTRLDAHKRLLRRYLSVHLCSLLFANLGYQLLQAAMTWTDEPDRWMARLATCPPGNQTLALNRALARLSPQDVNENSPALQAFLERFGARSDASWEIFSVRWREHPEALLPLLSQQGSPDDAEAIEARLQSDLHTLLGELPTHQAWLLGHLVHLTRRYLLLRENQRFTFEKLTASLKTTLLELGRHLELDPHDLPFWTLPELEALARGEPVPEVDHARRRDAWEHATHAPPTFLRGDQPVRDVLQTGRLQGTSVSPGLVTGPVRIARTIADGEALLQGEILVVPSLDPGWTPLLLRASGLIMELGSALSHGAIIAREYQVPAVANVDGITRRLETGQTVTVDGTRGVVWLAQ